MAHVPYGYVIRHGKAEIDETAAMQIRELFSYYLEGLSLAETAEATGIQKPHPSIGRMLVNRKYLGDGFYPPLINKDTFMRAESEKLRRATVLGRIHEPEEKEKAMPGVRFTMPNIMKKYDDPFMQAEYAYSLIECEVEQDAG